MVAPRIGGRDGEIRCQNGGAMASLDIRPQASHEHGSISKGAALLAKLRRFARRISRIRRRPLDDRWLAFAQSLSRVALTHDPERSPGAKRALFKRNVRMVELEPHAYCNRTCSFSPNSTIDRRTPTTRLDAGLFNRILGELHEIDYDGVVRFARYSEPMADDHIYDLVREKRRRLPKTVIDIVTNGDYLTPGALEKLRDDGLSILRISVYLPERTPWSSDAATEELARIGKRIESVGNLIDRDYVRHSPCPLVFSNFTLDFDGKLMPCCNLRGDHPGHSDFVLDDLSRGTVSIFDTYSNASWTGWRRSVAGVGAKDFPCRTCKQRALDGPPLESLERVVTERLREIEPGD